MEIQYSIFYKNRKSAQINIYPTGEIKVLAPIYYTEKDVISLINLKKEWILKKLSLIQKRTKNRIILNNDNILYLGEIYTFKKNSSMGRYTKIDKENKVIYAGYNLNNKENLLKFYKNEANFLLPVKLNKLSTIHNITYNKVTVRNNKKRWGSCSSKKDITLSTKLILAPIKVIEAVILHELVHTEIMNHSKKFYDRLYKICPFYREADIWLREYYPIENNIFY